MSAFRYRGRGPDGAAVEGVLHAASAEAAAGLLFERGVVPVDIARAEQRTALLDTLRRHLPGGRVDSEALVFFCQQMHSLLKAGVPLLRALQGLRETTESPALARVIGDLADALDAGRDLAGALGEHPEVFSPLFQSLVRMGETTGRLEEAFAQLIAYLEREEETRRRVRTALRYPGFVLAAIVVAMFVINLFVIPAFAQVYANFHSELPWATRVLIRVSDFFVAHWRALAAGLLGLVLLLARYLASDGGRYRWHRLKLKLPVVGSIIYQATLARFARALAMVTASGVPLVQGMGVISRAVDNDYLRDRILVMRDGIERGRSITETARESGMFPPTVVQMIAVGEASGSVDTLMDEVAGYYDRAVDYELARLGAAIEPLLTLAIAALVLMLALGVFLPMWDLATAVRGR